ncbi:hypothetical protein [uncultured Deinococcus sp.]|uniref:hypothetical protein n=1 Tax=uncultured Deinococcus sp. TaxID=158789 RepID=UPI0025E12416|nr:hypothetical protein [uncultured Deinococcus sp.]
MTARAALLAALIAGAPAGAQGTGTALPGSALPGMTVPTAVPATSVVLLDGQKLTVSVAFAPGSGDAPYPPAVPFSKTSPAYYPASGDARNIHLSVQSALSSAALVLRAHVVTVPGQPALPLDRIEYSVNGAPFVPSTALQVIGLLPTTGAATFEIVLRLRLEGDEPAGRSQAVLSWSVEAR